MQLGSSNLATAIDGSRSSALCECYLRLATWHMAPLAKPHIWYYRWLEFPPFVWQHWPSPKMMDHVIHHRDPSSVFPVIRGQII